MDKFNCIDRKNVGRTKCISHTAGGRNRKITYIRLIKLYPRLQSGVCGGENKSQSQKVAGCLVLAVFCGFVSHELSTFLRVELKRSKMLISPGAPPLLNGWADGQMMDREGLQRKG